MVKDGPDETALDTALHEIHGKCGATALHNGKDRVDHGLQRSDGHVAGDLPIEYVAVGHVAAKAVSYTSVLRRTAPYLIGSGANNRGIQTYWLGTSGGRPGRPDNSG